MGSRRSDTFTGIPASVRVEVFFREVPRVQALPDDRVGFELLDPSSRLRFWVEMPGRSFRKSRKSMRLYPPWRAKLSGALGRFRKHRMTLDNPAIEVAWRWPKGLDEPTLPTDADADAPEGFRWRGPKELKHDPLVGALAPELSVTKTLEGTASFALTFEELPDPKPMPKKRFELALFAENIQFNQLVNRKTWRSALDSIADLPRWRVKVHGAKVVHREDLRLWLGPAKVIVYEPKAGSASSMLSAATP